MKFIIGFFSLLLGLNVAVPQKNESPVLLWSMDSSGQAADELEMSTWLGIYTRGSNAASELAVLLLLTQLC